MAYPRASIRPRANKRKASSSPLAKITLCAMVLLAIICFLPVGNMARAQDNNGTGREDVGHVIGIDLGTTYS
jgi:heat shock protein 5